MQEIIMDLSRKSLAIALTVALTLPLVPIASAAEIGVLYPPPETNENLALGIYAVGGAHPSGETFIDDFNFSLANTVNVSFSITDNVSTDTAANPSPSGSNYLFDNQFLTFSVFDHMGNYLGSGSDGTPLLLSSLAGGELYTLTVSGKAAGIFGGSYQGAVDVGAVPLGATLPMFSAGLLTALCIRRRQRAA
jgi:hypothetical protein